MSNLDKLNKIISGKKSPWLEETAWRTENESWLTYSFDIAVKVIDTLRAKKMTQKDLAERMDVSPQFINKLVKGQENLSLETIGKLSQALGVRLIEVVFEERHAEVVYDYAQAFEVSELYRREIFTKASTQGYVGLEAVQLYAKEQVLEYKIPA